MKKANISTIPKKNKSRLILKNERNIFIVNTVRGILMRILFNRKLRCLTLICLIVTSEDEKTKVASITFGWYMESYMNSLAPSIILL